MLGLHALQIGHDQRVLAQLPETEVAAGEFICLLGRNGQGKSTLLRTLGGFIRPLAGEVRLNGTPLQAMSGPTRARHVGVVLTDRPQIAGMRVQALVELGRQPYTRWSGVLGESDRAIAAKALELVDGTQLSRREVDSLSDGERQRVMIARALAQQPDVLLLDEITAFLDLPSRVTMVDMLRRVAIEQRVAVVLSSHDLELSLQTADRLWLLPGDGRLIDGIPEDVVLSGEIGRAFDQPNLAFSPESGRFERPQRDGQWVFVEGTDTASLWLARALQRRGYRIAPQREQCTDHITRSAHGWSLSNGASAISIGGVLALLSAQTTMSPPGR